MGRWNTKCSTSRKIRYRPSIRYYNLIVILVILQVENSYLIKAEPEKVMNIKDARTNCDYIFLDTGERKFFAQNKHIYLIDQLQTNGINEYTKGQENNKILLEFNHPCKELVWVNSLIYIKIYK